MVQKQTYVVNLMISSDEVVEISLLSFWRSDVVSCVARSRGGCLSMLTSQPACLFLSGELFRMPVVVAGLRLALFCVEPLGVIAAWNAVYNSFGVEVVVRSIFVVFLSSTAGHCRKLELTTKPMSLGWVDRGCRRTGLSTSSW